MATSRDIIVGLQKQVIDSLLRLTNPRSQPNINKLWDIAKDIDVLRMNSKNFGYILGQSLLPALRSIDFSSEPQPHGLVSKPTTQSDVQSPWFVYWCAQLKIAPLFHRKLWEFAFVLQVLWEHGMLRAGTRGLGFGCGEEPLASYFASCGMSVTVTDLHPDKAAGAGWVETGQHTSSREKAFFERLVSRDVFDRMVKFGFADMNAIPRALQGFDFCWSICALEHLGSIRKGLEFIQNSLATIRSGGLAVHTTEFKYREGAETIDNWSTVLFRKTDFEGLANALRAQGHTVLGIDYDVGDMPLDRFIDVPPYGIGEGLLTREIWESINPAAHLKLCIDGFPSTCIGIVVIKA